MFDPKKICTYLAISDTRDITVKTKQTKKQNTKLADCNERT